MSGKIGIYAIGFGWIRSHEDTLDGRGHTMFTPDKQLARSFESIGDAFEFYRQQSKTVKLRDDGKPNRPITAFTVEIMPLDEEPLDVREQ